MKLLGCCLGLGVGLATFACSGKYDVGFEPTGGAAGTSMSNNDAGADSSNAAGSASGGSPSVAGSGPGPVAGSGGGAPLPRCYYGPDEVAPANEFAVSEELANRVFRFLDATDAPSNLTLPASPNATWVAALAKTILDGHEANETAAPGLVRFLAGWLPSPIADVDFNAPALWGKKLVAADATLATLLSEPTGEPHRFGIITEPDVLTVTTRISERGSWMSKALFCQEPPPPPANLPAFEPTPAQGKTFRQHLEASVAAPACAACHQIFDPLGDSLENFDAAGNYRTLDNGQPVDASGTIQLGETSFDDFASLAPQLAESCEVSACIGRSLFNDALEAGLAPRQVTFTEAEGNRVATELFASDFKVRALVKAIVTSPSFLR